MGSLPAKSAMKSNDPRSRAGSRCSRAMARMCVLHRRHLGRGEALADQRAHPGVAGRVEGQERHELVGVGPEGAGLERYPLGVGEAVEIAEGGQHVLVVGTGPRSRAPRCGTPGPRPAGGRRRDRDPRGSRRRRGCRPRAGRRWSSAPHPSLVVRRSGAWPRRPRTRGCPSRTCARCRRPAVPPRTTSGAPAPPWGPRRGPPPRPGGGGSGSRSGRAGASRRGWCSSRALVEASTSAGLPVVNRTMARTASYTRSCTDRLSLGSHGGRACMPRQSTSANRWSLELK